MNLLFVSHQLDQPFLRYVQWNIWPWKITSKILNENFSKKVSNRIPPESNHVISITRGIQLPSLVVTCRVDLTLSCRQAGFFFSNILFPRMSTYCQTWLISLTFVLYAVKKHCETLIRFFVSVVREKYIEIVLVCHMMNFYSSKIARLGSAGCAMKTFSPSIT